MKPIEEFRGEKRAEGPTTPSPKNSLQGALPLVAAIVVFLIAAFVPRSAARLSKDGNEVSAESTEKDGRLTKDFADSGMIQVALALAGVGFLLFQFGDKIEMPKDYTLFTTKTVGLALVLAGLTAATLLHAAFIRELSDQVRDGGKKLSVQLAILGGVGHLLLLLVFVGAMTWAALALGGWWLTYPVLFLVGVAILIFM